ncbi:MAG TPA: isoprenylcysteine carboxylmethyltransferase family protein [Rubrobacteraceae bacterium]|nr:isoprenylcysteine carboxylmethyltransferase family protein [Rubrobacteraceae bacterium]
MLKKLLIGVALISTQRLLELRLSRRNERRLRSRGAVERGREHYPLMAGLHALWLAFTLLEGSARKTRLRRLPLVSFLAVQPLRYWAIHALGEHWNTRILVVPGEKLVNKGPYKYLSHPNYLVVIVEILTFPLIFGAHLTALMCSALNAVLLSARIKEEERALKELAESPNDG